MVSTIQAAQTNIRPEGITGSIFFPLIAAT
jgi:hypothetical protein